jgi:hypothetical protein
MPLWVSMSICEKTITLIFPDLELVHHRFDIHLQANLTPTNFILIMLVTGHSLSTTIITPWPESASKLYGPSDRHLAKLVPTFADRGSHVVSSQLLLLTSSSSYIATDGQSASSLNERQDDG